MRLLNGFYFVLQSDEIYLTKSLEAEFAYVSSMN